MIVKTIGGPQPSGGNSLPMPSTFTTMMRMSQVGYHRRADRQRADFQQPPAGDTLSSISES